MNHALAMRVAEGISDLLADFADAVEGEALAFLDGVGKSAALNKLHHQEGRAVILAHVEDGHDAGMRQHAGGAGLAIKTRAVFFALRRRRGPRNGWS